MSRRWRSSTPSATTTATSPDCALIIDIGARTTNLVFIEPNKVFSRSISSGGNTITAAIAKEFHEPFGAAEERKKRDGFVSLGGAYADPDDPEVARVSKITRNTMTRLHAEISRSISFYRSQQAGAQPSRIFLAGATTSMPYMREFFQEKFQLPVEFFNPLRNVTVSSTQDVEEIGRKAHTFGGLVGLALRSVASCPMELNLRPAGVIRRQIAAKQKPAFVLAAVCLLAGLTAWWMYYAKIAQSDERVHQRAAAAAGRGASGDRDEDEGDRQADAGAAGFRPAAAPRGERPGLLGEGDQRHQHAAAGEIHLDHGLRAGRGRGRDSRDAGRRAEEGRSAANRRRPRPRSSSRSGACMPSTRKAARVVEEFIEELNESDSFGRPSTRIPEEHPHAAG